ncbi:MAG: hypothetical protein H5U29_12445 [Pusillimonas sp.]|nr:hypothetical protein [Pusillimonas sp.]
MSQPACTLQVLSNTQKTTLPNRFANVPIDSDTTIISQRQITVQGISVLNQHWRWDGARAESLIFVAESFE